MRLVIALLGLALLTAAAPARDWTQAVRQTPQGAYVMGNPAAPQKLVEYGSYTCPHCAHFAVSSEPVLKGQMIRSGRVSLEYRNLIRDPLDMAAAILARCGGAKGFFGASQAIFASQQAWLERAVAWQDAHPEVQMMGDAAKLRGYAEGSGLTDLMKRRGLSAAQIDACFADPKAPERILALTTAAPVEVQYTPAFFLNGAFVANGDWAKIQTLLAARRGG